MRRAAHVAVRYERARIYEQFGITTGAQSRDEQLITQLPETFWWEEVADLWNVKRRAAVDACDDDGEECLLGHPRRNRRISCGWR